MGVDQSDLEIKEKVINQLRGVVDPELGSDIVDLGMVKEVDFKETGDLHITIALTTAGCPLKAQIQKDVRLRMKNILEITSVKIEWTELTDAERAQTMDRARFNLSQEDVVTQIPRTTKSIMIASGKGGVGKSSVTANIATGLAARGLTVGVLDADIWGFSIPRLLGIKGRIEANEDKLMVPFVYDNLKVISTGLITSDEDTALMWRGLMLSKALEQFLTNVEWGDLDYLIIDLPPGTGDIQMALSRLLPQAELIVVTTPQLMAQKVATRVADMAKRSFIPLLGVIENMSYFETNTGDKFNIFGQGGGDALAEQFALPMLGKIPISEDTNDIADDGTPLILQEKNTPTKTEIEKLVSVIAEKLPPIVDETCTGRLAKVFEELAK